MKTWMILLVTALLALGGCNDNDGGAASIDEATAGPSSPTGEKAPPSPPTL